MNIHEYQAKELLRQFGIPTPDGMAAFSVREAGEATQQLPGPLFVVKAQIHAGGRGKGKFKEASAGEKGGVRLAKSRAEVQSFAEQMLGATLVNLTSTTTTPGPLTYQWTSTCGGVFGTSTAANTTFKGGGSTTRSGALNAVLTARVAGVLPNGDLELEGVREIDINGDRQILVVTGVVRPSDVGPGNVVPSTAVGQMRIRYFGRGLIKDNLNPGWLVRVLNKIF